MSTNGKSEGGVDVSPPLATDHGPHVESRAETYWLTYETLRWLMVALAGMLLAVTVGTAVWTGHLPGSISDYYGGPVRDVFVGVLFAVAACLVAYRGSTPLEDFALNGAGFYALFVALLPTTLEKSLTPPESPLPDSISADEIKKYLMVTYAAVVLLLVALAVLETKIASRKKLTDTGGGSKAFVVAAVTVLVLFVIGAGVAVFTGHPADHFTFNSNVWSGLRLHDYAAFLLIASLAVAVWTHAISGDESNQSRLPDSLRWPTSGPKAAWEPEKQLTLEPTSTTPQFTLFYRTILILMTGGAVIVWLVSAKLWPEHTILILEWFEIILFMAFWIAETRREGKARRGELGR